MKRKRTPRAERATRPADDRVDEAARRSYLIQLSTAGGIVAAMVIAVLLNILAARHYRRWDVTDAGLYTLSRPTEQTLARIDGPIEIYALVSRASALSLTLRHLLEAYRSLAPDLAVRFVDPDAEPAELLRIQQRFGVEATRTEGGALVTDAAIIVARGERTHFISEAELFELEEGAGDQARPRIEQALTGALVQVLRGEPRKICFTQGHGEAGFDVGGPEGLVALRGRLEKTNYEAVALPPLRELRSADPIDDCALVVLAGPVHPFARDETARLERYFDGGGNVLVAAGPEFDPTRGTPVSLGLESLLARAGIVKRTDVVFERDPTRMLTGGQGEVFFSEPQLHSITQGFVELQGAISLPVQLVSSLTTRADAPAAPAPLLVTSPDAFGLGDIRAWLESDAEAVPGSNDARGALVIAYASELPKRDPDAAHGPRMVVFGTKSVIVGANWVSEPLRGTGMLVENAISWLADEPVIVSVPEKPARQIGLRLTKEMLSASLYKIVVLLPLGTLLLGLGIHLRRRSTEGRKRREEAA